MYDADPGNVFPSNVHRRVLAYLPGPVDTGQTMTPAELLLRANNDKDDLHVTLDLTATEAVLDELVATKDAQVVGDDAYTRTTTGQAKLEGPAYIQKEVQAEDGTVTVDLVEEPPLEGRPLARAEEANEERAEQDREIEKANKAKRKEELEAELAALEEE